MFTFVITTFAKMLIAFLISHPSATPVANYPAGTDLSSVPASFACVLNADNTLTCYQPGNGD